MLPCLSRRLSYLISKAISCMIDLKIKQIRKKSIYHERYGISSVCFKDLSQRKNLEVVSLTIVSQFGVNFKIMFLVVQYQDHWLRSCVNFKIMFLVVQYQDHWLRSSFKTEIPSPANEASFVHVAAQIKCYLKHEHAKCSCVAEWLRALQKLIVRVRVLAKPSFYLI